MDFRFRISGFRFWGLRFWILFFEDWFWVVLSLDCGSWWSDLEGLLLDTCVKCLAATITWDDKYQAIHTNDQPRDQNSRNRTDHSVRLKKLELNSTLEYATRSENARHTVRIESPSLGKWCKVVFFIFKYVTASPIDPSPGGTMNSSFVFCYIAGKVYGC